jgi:hypothetical protein
VTDNSDGTYTATYFPEVKGTYDVSVGLATPGGLTARYYDNVWFLNSPAVSRVDATINFQWGTGALTTFGVDYVSVRWEGKLRSAFSEATTIYALADDGVRVWIDRRLVIDAWSTCCNESFAVVSLVANHLHDIIVEYQELRGEARMELRWSSASMPKAIIPSSALYSVAPISGSPFTNVAIGSGEPISGAHSTASGAALTQGVAGVLASFTVTARDTFGNVLDAAAATPPAVSVSGGSPTVAVSYLANGQYQVDVTVNTAGTYLLNVNPGGVHVTGSPFALVIAPAATSATACLTSGAGFTTATAGVTASFTVTARDALNNARTVGGDSVSAVISNGVITVPAAVTDEGNGGYTVRYTPTASGAHTVSVVVNGTPIGAASALTVAAGALHAPSCTVTGTAVAGSATSGAATALAVATRDKFGNALSASSGAVVTVQRVTAAGTATSIVVTDNLDGTYSASVTTNTAGTYTLVVRVNGIDVSGSPFALVVSPGALSAAASTATGAALANARVGTAATVLVQARDAQGNALSTGGSTLACSINCGSAVAGTGTYTSAGAYQCVYTPTASGASCSLTITLGGAAVSGSPFTVAVAAAPASASASGTMGAAKTAGTAGTVSTFTIVSRDQYSTALSAGGELFTATVLAAGPAGANITATVTDLGTGSYTVSYTPQRAGTFQTSVRLVSALGLTGAYFLDAAMTTLAASRVDSQVSFDWGLGGPSLPVAFPADHFAVRWSGLLRVPASETFTFFTSITARSGVRLWVNRALVINQWAPSAGSSEPFGSIALQSGVYYEVLLHYQATDGPAGITLLWQSPSTTKAAIPASSLFQNENLGDSSPYTTVISPGASVAATTTAHSTLPASPTTDLTALSSSVSAAHTAGTAIVVQLQLRDALGNLQTAAGAASVSATLTHLDTATNRGAPSITDAAPGVVQVSVTPDLKGAYDLHLRVSGTGVVSSPFRLQVSPGAVSGAQCTLSGVPASVAAGAAAAFTIQARDAQGNALASGGAVFALTLSGPGSGSGTVSDNGDGTYTATFTAPTLANAWTLNVRLNGVTHVSGSPAALTVTPSVAHSSTTALAAAIGACTGGAACQFTVAARDAFGNALSTGGSRFEVVVSDRRGGFTKGSVTDGGTGSYTVSFTVPTGAYSIFTRLVGSLDNGVNGLRGDYFNNRWLQGTPELTRRDPTINFAWGTGLVTPTSGDYVSVRWTGFISPPSSGARTFYFDGDASARMYVDDLLVFDNWSSAPGEFTGSFNFPTANILYPLRIEYREETGAAQAVLSWDLGGSKTLVLSTYLFTPASEISASPFAHTVS